MTDFCKICELNRSFKICSLCETDICEKCFILCENCYNYICYYCEKDNGNICAICKEFMNKIFNLQLE
jgi:hypothetical protein